MTESNRAIIGAVQDIFTISFEGLIEPLSDRLDGMRRQDRNGIIEEGRKIREHDDRMTQRRVNAVIAATQDKIAGEMRVHERDSELRDKENERQGRRFRQLIFATIFLVSVAAIIMIALLSFAAWLLQGYWKNS